MVLCLRGVAARVGNVEPSVVVGYALRFVAHVAGVDNILRAQVDFCHIAVVGIRRYIEKSTAVGSKPPVVGYILRGGYGRAVGPYVLYDVRPVDADGNERVVHLENVVGRVAKFVSGVLLLEPAVCQHTVVEQGERRVVHAPQPLAHDDEAVAVGCGLPVVVV